MHLEQNEWWEKFQADENGVIIDVRSEDEFEESRIPSALNLNIYKGQGFIYQIEELDKSKNYYVYCKAGGRSAQACAVMNQLGFENTFNLEGGFMQWKGEVAFPEEK